MIRTLISFTALLFFSLQATAQIHPQLYSGRQEMFLEAESYFLFEEYNEALPLYLELLREQPGNFFLNYRAGRCYINMPGQKEKAIPFLEKAIDDIDPRERRPTFRTTRAPLDALFYLGNAYHINYRFEDALDMYRLFREKMSLTVYSAEVVEDYIRASLNAIEKVRNRVFFLEENLGERINTRFSDKRPAVSGNENVLVFSRELPFYDGIFFSEKTGGEWSWPVEITTMIGCEGDCYPVSLSWDGKKLFLYKSDNLVGNIYVSSFEAGEWSAIRKLNQNINSRHWESHASLSRGGDTLYFSSNRPGGFGGLDIYYSVRNARGDWGPAVNLGADINTPFNEDAPFISEDGTTLYFSSLGHTSIGGYDIFYSSRTGNGGWTSPRNAGYGINTPEDDLYFVPVKNGRYAYVSKFSSNGFGEMDIYRYEIFSENNPRRFLVTGSMKRTDGLEPGASASINVIDPSSRNVIYSGKPDPHTGEYGLMLETGEWMIVFSEEGHEDITRKIRLSADREDSELTLHVEMKRAETDGSQPVLTGISPPDEDSPYAEAESPAGRIPYRHTDPEGDALSAEEERTPDRYSDPEGDALTTEAIGDTVPQEDEEIIAGERIIQENDTVIEPDYFDTPVPAEEETAEPGRVIPFRLILILALLLLVAFYFKERQNRNKRKS